MEALLRKPFLHAASFNILPFFLREESRYTMMTTFCFAGDRIMLQFKKIIILLLLLTWFGVEAQSIHYENQVIEKIEIVVENLCGGSFDTASILSRIKTRQGDMFSHVDFDNDLKTLAKEFDRVLPFFETLNGKMYITLRIWPKPTIRNITYCGNTRIKSKELQKELGITPGSLLDRQAFNKAFHKLKAHYVKKGFFEAELTYDIALDENCNEVDLVISVNEGRAGKIKTINFSGFTRHEENELLDILVTKGYNPLTSWFTNQGTYNEDMVAHDQLAVLNYIQNEGYADAKVFVTVDEAKQCDRIILNITLDRGDIYTFGDITFVGNKLFCDEEIWKQMEFAKGDPYSPDSIRDTIKAITDYYGRRGYIDAVVDFEPFLDCENRLYSVNFTIEEGARYNVGVIKVFGNCSTQTKVILHETLLVPGEVFNIDKLQKTEERLQNVGYFKNVNVYAVKSEDECGLGGAYRDVHIEVEETNTGHFTTQFGFSTAESLFGGVSITEKNFNYKGLSCIRTDGLKALRGGGEYVHLNATWGTKSTKYEIGWTKPYFMDTKWTVGFDLDKTSTRYISDDYSIDGEGLMLHASYQNNAFLRTGWHYRLRNTRIIVDSLKHSRKKHEEELSEAKNEKEKHELHQEWLRKKHDHHKLKERAKHAGIVSAWGTTLTYDSTDHPSHPRSGFRSRLMGEVAGIGGYHSFIGLAYNNTYYYPLHRRGTLKFRGDWRFLIPYGDTTTHNIPIDEKLFLGGDTNVRGYRNYRLGPQAGKDDPLGGTSMQFYSIEYDRKLMKKASLFFFFDAGALNDKIFSFGRINMAVGYGIRVKVLDSLPSLTFGMGYPLNPRKNSDVKKFFFQMGGQF